MKVKIPKMNEILKPVWEHKHGYGFINKKWEKKKILEQATTPEDSRILKKVGIKKGDKILAIAAYYASWAAALAEKGAIVDYNDVSSSMVSYCKKRYGKLFKRYILSNYELIPKKIKEYDWTFTFESCGEERGLPIAYLRSLFNKKGGKLIIYYKKGHTGGKHKAYPKIIKILSKIYRVRTSIKEVKIKVDRMHKYKGNLPHRVYTIFTNNLARSKAEQDLEVLKHIKQKIIIDLEGDSKNLGISKKGLEESIKRLSKLNTIIKDECLREIEIK